MISIENSYVFGESILYFLPIRKYNILPIIEVNKTTKVQINLLFPSNRFFKISIKAIIGIIKNKEPNANNCQPAIIEKYTIINFSFKN